MIFSRLPHLSLIVCLLGAGPAAALEAVADSCEAALASGDRAAFDAAVDAIRPRKDVFDTELRQRVEACLSKGFGEPWAYSFPESEWLPVAEEQRRADQRTAAKAATTAADAEAADRAARAEEERQHNAKRVADLVYISCTIVLKRDQVEAMTNALCVESFLANGLPLR